MDQNEIRHDPRHLGVASGVSKMISEPMVHSAQTVHLTYIKVGTIAKQTENERPLERRHLGVPSSVSKTISEPMVHSAQTVHLSCVNICTISKWTKTSFHFSLITYEFHRVRPK